MRPSNHLKLCLSVVTALLLAGCERPRVPQKESVPPKGPSGAGPSQPAATSQSELEALRLRVDALEATLAALNRDASLAITSLDQRLDAEELVTGTVAEALQGVGTRLSGLEVTVIDHGRAVAAQGAELAAVSDATQVLTTLSDRLKVVETKTLPLSIEYDEKGIRTVVFTGVNVQLLNHSRSELPDGSGNLILGLNETDGRTLERKGSYNVVIGKGHSYTGTYNLIGGYRNKAAENSVVFGSHNESSGRLNAILAGSNNKAQAVSGAILGGAANRIDTGMDGTVLGGTSNIGNYNQSVTPTPVWQKN